MNRYNIHGHLLEMGHDWEEAEAITSGLAEAERDAEIEREYERAMRAQWLEAFDRFNKEKA